MRKTVVYGIAIITSLTIGTTAFAESVEAPEPGNSGNTAGVQAAEPTGFNEGPGMSPASNENPGLGGPASGNAYGK